MTFLAGILFLTISIFIPILAYIVFYKGRKLRAKDSYLHHTQMLAKIKLLEKEYLEEVYVFFNVVNSHASADIRVGNASSSLSPLSYKCRPSVHPQFFLYIRRLVKQFNTEFYTKVQLEVVGKEGPLAFGEGIILFRVISEMARYNGEGDFETVDIFFLALPFFQLSIEVIRSPTATSVDADKYIRSVIQLSCALQVIYHARAGLAEHWVIGIKESVGNDEN